jgi:hypothetical protein
MQKIYRKALKNYVYELHKKFRIRLKDAKELAPEDARGKEGKLLPFGRSPQLAYTVLASGCSPAGRRLAAAISHRLGKTSPKLGQDVLYFCERETEASWYRPYSFVFAAWLGLSGKITDVTLFIYIF